MQGKDEPQRVFLEKKLLSSMLHEDQRWCGSPIGEFEYPLQLEISFSVLVRYASDSKDC